MNLNLELTGYFRLLTIVIIVTLAGCEQRLDATTPSAGTASSTVVDLTDEQVENIVRRSYQYVAMYNVNNKFAMDPSNPMTTGGWNRVQAATTLADHTLQAIARPNNDTLYASAMLDLREEPIILEAPAVDSTYGSLMVTGYDHFVSIPMSKRMGDFSEPSRILIFTERTKGYNGEAIEGVDTIHEETGDFVSAIYRFMPHANDPDRYARVAAAMQAIKVIPLSEYLTGTAADAGSAVNFPDYGLTDFDVFENNLLEVMQFVFNHTTFDDDDNLDQELLAAYEPLGVVPGRNFDASRVAAIDGQRFREAAQRVAAKKMGIVADPEAVAVFLGDLFQPKGEMALTPLILQSVAGPIGQPKAEAVYPPIGTVDGTPMNAMNDYVIRMSPEEMPPAMAFWSVTLYDNENGFFLPNDRKKYSVGENSGLQLDKNGGIEIHLAAEQPAGVPADNWLPVPRGDYGMDIIMRLYAPDLERYDAWNPPKAALIEGN